MSVSEKNTDLTEVSCPRGWSISQAPKSIEVTFHAIRARGVSGATIFTVVIGLLCGYQVYSFLVNWFVDRAEILPAGVVLFLFMCGGLIFTVRNIRLLFRTVTYRFGENDLEAIEHSLWTKTTKKSINRSSVQKILVLYTPPSDSRLDGTLRTALEFVSPDQKRQEFFFEGYSEAESNFLRDVLKTWVDVAVERQNTAL